MRRKLYLMIALLVALAVTGGAFAYTQTSGSVSTTVSAGSFAAVTPVGGTAPEEGWVHGGTPPSWDPIEGVAGSITGGDLYYINPGDYNGRLLVTLYVTNVPELAGCYSYLNMKVQAYKYDTTSNSYSTENLDLYLTLTNGYVSFILEPGIHVITIDGGSWYCFDADAEGGSLSPSFYIEVRQA